MCVCVCVNDDSSCSALGPSKICREGMVGGGGGGGGGGGVNNELREGGGRGWQILPSSGDCAGNCERLMHKHQEQ